MAIFFSCCSDVKEYWVMNNFQTELTLKDNSLLLDSTATDTLYIQINPEVTFVSSIQSEMSSFFVNSSHALSCPHPGDAGLKHKLMNILVTSNEEYNGFAADENIASIVKLDDQSIQEILSSGYLYPYGATIELNQKPTQAVERNFTITFEFDNATSLTQTTSSITWY